VKPKSPGRPPKSYSTASLRTQQKIRKSARETLAELYGEDEVDRIILDLQPITNKKTSTEICYQRLKKNVTELLSLRSKLVSISLAEAVLLKRLPEGEIRTVSTTISLIFLLVLNTMLIILTMFG
jgi:hypothetical protein